MEEIRMKNLQNQLKTVSKSLARLSKQVESINKRIGQLQPASSQAGKGKPATKKRSPQKAGSGRSATVLDSVYDVIKRSRKGVNIATLRQKTGLDARQVSNALYKLTKKGDVHAKSRGVYAKK
jgi:predicted Rossmann fold nucleotide-binding protein DprA/Smf involved in DNA uptake